MTWEELALFASLAVALMLCIAGILINITPRPEYPRPRLHARGRARAENVRPAQHSAEDREVLTYRVGPHRSSTYGPQ